MSTIAIILFITQAMIMFSLGLGLEVQDFKNVARRWKVFLTAASLQVIALPAVAFGIAIIFEFSPLFSAGLMLLALCPGGVSSNVISKLSYGDVALSVSLTGVLSVFTFISIPPLAALFIGHFVGGEIGDFSMLDLMKTTFMIATGPVIAGVLLRHFWSRLAIKIEPYMDKIAVTLWTLIVIAAFYSLREPLMANFKHIGVGLFVLPIVMILIGLLVSRLMRMNERESKTVGIELTIQNSPMALALAAVISGGGLEVTELAIPAAVYSATMYLVAVPCIFIFRSMSRDKRTVAVGAVS